MTEERETIYRAALDHITGLYVVYPWFGFKWWNFWGMKKQLQFHINTEEKMRRIAQDGLNGVYSPDEYV